MEREPREADEPALKTIDRAARVLWVLARGSREGLPLGSIGRLSVTRCCLRMNGRFAPTAVGHR